ncbi:MAG: hydrogenase maturation protease [Planctomycetes bacterium]|nr:hydrogenase maturation protease [Planctomycetota bacterium]
MSKNNKTAVIGIGNLLLMDEGVGVHVINELGKHKLPGKVKIFDGGTGGLKLIDLMRDADNVIFIDAVETDRASGVFFTFKPDDVSLMYREKKYSLHDTNLQDVIRMAEVLGKPPKMKIIGIRPKTIGYGMELSTELRNLMPDIINHVLNEIEEVCSIPTA